MSEELTETGEEAWVNLLRASQHIHCAIERALKAEGFPGLDWYDVLLELKRVAPTDLRPFELQEKLLLKQYNLSRLLARMVEAGVIEKRVCPEDGRGYGFFITNNGIKQQQAMWPIYKGVLVSEFTGKIASDDAEALAVILSKVTPKAGV